MELCTLLVQTGGLVPDCIVCSTASCSRVLVFLDPLASLVFHHLLPWHQSQLSSLCGESGHLVHPGVVSQPCRSPQPRYERLLAPQPRYSRAGSPGSPSKSTDEPSSTGPFWCLLFFEQSPRTQQKLLQQLLRPPGVLRFQCLSDRLKKPPLRAAVEVK